MTIEKSGKNEKTLLRPSQVYPSARTAFGQLLDFLGVGAGDKVLLPAYIGWSVNEGSGVFDPVRERGIIPIFYHMDKKLSIDKADLLKKMDENRVKALLLIHYFGFCDNESAAICAAARNAGVCVIEDSAHAMLSDKIGMVCGRDGDYTLYSLHKMLPMNDGGMLVDNFCKGLPSDHSDYSHANGWSDFDLAGIAKKRIENYHVIKEYLDKLRCGEIEILRPELKPGTIPQTFPIILHGISRDSIYAEMNRRGWGVVSLYHTMIDLINKDEYRDECYIAKHITNLPVHQDVDAHDLIDLMNCLVSLIKENRETE